MPQTPESSTAHSWELYERWRDYREPFERQWHLNLAMLIGRQYARWNMAAKKLEDAARDDIGISGSSTRPKRSRVVSNHILPLYRQKLSDFLKLKPDIQVASATQDESDLKAAEICNTLVDHVEIRHEFQMLWRRLWLLLMTFGSGTIYPCWDPSAGPAGEEEVNLLTPFETFWPRSRWPSPPNELIIVQATALEDIKARYDADVAGEADAASSSVEQQIRMLLDQRQEFEPGEDVARVLTHFKLPCPSYPKGFYRVQTKDKELYYGELPAWYYDDSGRALLPGVDFCFQDIPLCTYAQSFVEPLISPQREYNHKISRITDHFRKLSGKWLIPFGSNLKEPINNQSDQVIYYDAMAGMPPPVAATVPGLPASLFQDLARCKADMQDIAGSHDVSHGKVPAGVRAGKAIAALQERDESQHAPIVLGVEEKAGRVVMLLLNIIQHNYQEQRTLDIVGGGKRYQLKDFTGRQIIGARTVTVSMGSAFPYSRIARQEQVMELYTAGLIDREEARQQLQLNESKQLPQNVELMAAKQAVEQMLQGVLVEVHSFSNHALHLKVINETRADPDFQEQAPSEVKMIFDLVADLHQQVLLKELQAQMAGPLGVGGMPQALPGAQPPAPGPQRGV